MYAMFSQSSFSSLLSRFWTQMRLKKSYCIALKYEERNYLLMVYIMMILPIFIRENTSWRKFVEREFEILKSENILELF